MTTGAAYNLAYPRSPLKQAETATSEPMLKPDVEIKGEHCERIVTQRSGVAQGKFKTLLIENFAGRCAVTGWVNAVSWMRHTLKMELGTIRLTAS